jgi:hypothetical protein
MNINGFDTFAINENGGHALGFTILEVCRMG